MEKPQIIVHLERSLTYTVFDIKWFPKSAKVVVVGSNPNGTGVIEMYEMEESDLVLRHKLSRPKPVKCATFGAALLEERHVSVGDFEGHLDILDVNENKSVYSTQAHSSIINCIDGVAGFNIGKGAPELVTGSKDGCVRVWDPRQKDSPVISIEPATEEERRDCWSVCFGDSYGTDARCIAAGFDNGDVKMFDLRTSQLLYETNLGNGVCGLEFDRKDIKINKLVATCLEAKIHVFDTRTLHPEKGFSKLTEKRQPSTIWLARHLPQDRDIFATSGGDGGVFLWKYVYPSSRTKTLDDESIVGVVGELERLQNATISSQPITGLDWNRDKRGLMVCSSLDQTIRIAIITKLNLV